jgi:hypothetical protein
MLRKFAAALLATALIAGPAFAAPPAGSVGQTPATPTATAPAPANPAVKPAAKPTKMVKHVRKHLSRHKVSKIKVARHLKVSKTHRHHVASRIVAPAKAGKGEKAGKS